MKYLLILCLFFLTEFCAAQDKVMFDYDAAGNRIKRYMVSSFTVADNGSEETFNLEEFAEFDAKDEFVNGEINISPNPSTDIVKVEIMTPEGEAAEIVLYDGEGRILRNAKNVFHIEEFDISTLPAATYYCRITTKSKSGIWKIIKAR